MMTWRALRNSLISSNLSLLFVLFVEPLELRPIFRSLSCRRSGVMAREDQCSYCGDRIRDFLSPDYRLRCSCFFSRAISSFKFAISLSCSSTFLPRSSRMSTRVNSGELCRQSIFESYCSSFSVSRDLIGEQKSRLVRSRSVNSIPLASTSLWKSIISSLQSLTLTSSVWQHCVSVSRWASGVSWCSSSRIKLTCSSSKLHLTLNCSLAYLTTFWQTWTLASPTCPRTQSPTAGSAVFHPSTNSRWRLSILRTPDSTPMDLILAFLNCPSNSQFWTILIFSSLQQSNIRWVRVSLRASWGVDFSKISRTWKGPTSQELCSSFKLTNRGGSEGCQYLWGLCSQDSSKVQVYPSTWTLGTGRIHFVAGLSKADSRLWQTRTRSCCLLLSRLLNTGDRLNGSDIRTVQVLVISVWRFDILIFKFLIFKFIPILLPTVRKIKLLLTNSKEYSLGMFPIRDLRYSLILIILQKEMAKVLLDNFVADKQISDLQWRFSIAVSNSSITKYSECFIQMSIITIDKNQKEESLHLELNLSEFNDLYRDIDRIKNLLELMK